MFMLFASACRSVHVQEGVSGLCRGHGHAVLALCQRLGELEDTEEKEKEMGTRESVQSDCN